MLFASLLTIYRLFYVRTSLAATPHFSSESFEILTIRIVSTDRTVEKFHTIQIGLMIIVLLISKDAQNNALDFWGSDVRLLERKAEIQCARSFYRSVH